MKVDGPHTRRKQALRRYLSGSPWQRIALDFYGPLPLTDKGEKYILVVMDYFTKWVECFPTCNMEAATVVDILVKEIVPRYGLPDEVHSDQGRGFEGSVLKQLFEYWGVLKTRTTPYCPQSDGLIERFMRTLKNNMAKMLEGSQKHW